MQPSGTKQIKSKDDFFLFYFCSSNFRISKRIYSKALIRLLIDVLASFNTWPSSPGIYILFSKSNSVKEQFIFNYFRNLFSFAVSFEKFT